MTPRRVRLAFVAAVATAALVASACGGTPTTTETAQAPSPPPDAPLIVATTSILGDITANVVGDLAVVEVVMPLDSDPHDFEPSARDAAMLRDADLIVANGLQLEEGLLGPIESAAADGIPVIEVADFVDPIEWSDDDHDHDGDDDHSHDDDHDHDGDGDKSDKSDHEGDDHEGDDHDHDHGDLDPHFWQDPTRVAAAAEAIAQAVADNTDVNDEALQAQTAAYTAELAALDAELQEQFASIAPERRVMVTNHDAFGYLSARFGFDIVGTVFPSGSDLAEPGAASLVALAALIDELSVPAIFTENIASPDLANTLSREASTDVVVVPLFSDSLGPQGSGGETYLTMMRTNGNRIVEALG
jgi:zinc/manganese transport system substrate-binding protein